MIENISVSSHSLAVQKLDFSPQLRECIRKALSVLDPKHVERVNLIEVCVFQPKTASKYLIKKLGLPPATVFDFVNWRAGVHKLQAEEQKLREQAAGLKIEVEQLMTAKRLYQKRNRENSWQRARMKNDPAYRLGKYLRVKLRKILFVSKSPKHESAIKLVGCTVDELKSHLENQFKEGMSWENYGRWHIDHKRPISTFDLNLLEEQRKCFHFSNLQPLWADDNLSKSDTYQEAAA